MTGNISLSSFFETMRNEVTAVDDAPLLARWVRRHVDNLFIARRRRPGTFFTVRLDCPLRSALEEQAFDALLKLPESEVIEIPPVEDASFLPDLLQQALRLTSQERISIVFASGLSVTASHAESIFHAIHDSGLDGHSILFFVSSNDSLMDAFCRHVRESTTLSYLTLVLKELKDIRTIVDAIASSSSLIVVSLETTLLRTVTPENERGSIARILAETLARSESLRRLEISGLDATIMDRIGIFLTRTEEARNYDLFFKIDRPVLGTYELRLSRSSGPWKSLLASETIPLALWPTILQKANRWNDPETNHTPADTLFFLLREKCDVLTANANEEREPSSGAQAKWFVFSIPGYVSISILLSIVACIFAALLAVDWSRF